MVFFCSASLSIKYASIASVHLVSSWPWLGSELFSDHQNSQKSNTSDYCRDELEISLGSDTFSADMCCREIETHKLFGNFGLGLECLRLVSLMPSSVIYLLKDA